MLKRLVFALLAVGLLLGGAVPAYAAQTGSIRVVPETKPPADSAVTLYHVALRRTAATGWMMFTAGDW